MSVSLDSAAGNPLALLFSANTAPSTVVFLYALVDLLSFLRTVAKAVPAIPEQTVSVLSYGVQWVRRSMIILACTTLLAVATYDPPGQPYWYIGIAAFGLIGHYAERQT